MQFDQLPAPICPFSVFTEPGTDLLSNVLFCTLPLHISDGSSGWAEPVHACTLLICCILRIK